jgi:exosome complex protein LRP1
MDDLPPDLAQPVTDLASAISTIEAQVQRLQSAPWAELCKGLTPLEVARMHLMVAYTINTLFYIYLKTQGLPTANHPVREELERVKAYIRKVKEVSQAQRGGAAEAAAQGAVQRVIAEALAGSSSTSAPVADATHAAAGGAEGAPEAAPPELGGGPSSEAELRAALKQVKPTAGAGADADEAASGQLGALLQQHARESGLLQGGTPGSSSGGGAGGAGKAKRKGEGGAATPGSGKKKKKPKSNKEQL